jgi:integrase
MRLYKPTFKVEGGTTESPTWYLDFRQGPTRRRIPLFSHRVESVKAKEKIEQLLANTGTVLSLELAQWIEGVPAKIRNPLVKWGIVKDANTGKTLKAHIDDWKQHLEAKNNTEDHIQLITGRVRRVMDACKFVSWSDIDGHAVEQHLAGLRDDKPAKKKGEQPKPGISAQTYCFYVKNLKQFGKWMVRNRRAILNPFDNLEVVNTDTDRRHDRRALTADERAKLLTTTTTGPVRLGMAGIDRYWLYRLALETGLRADELRSLTVSSFDLEARTVTVKAGYSKRRREDVLPIGVGLCDELRGFLGGKMPSVNVFATMPSVDRISDMIQADLEAAGVAYVKDGLYADFHALRHSFVTGIVKSGASVKEAQTLARHSTPVLTLQRYTHIMLNDTRKVIDRMEAAAVSVTVKTGTNDQIVNTAGNVHYDQIQTGPDQTCRKLTNIDKVETTKPDLDECTKTTENNGFSHNTGENNHNGAVAEWLKATVLKTVEPQGSAGSNPACSGSVIRIFSNKTPTIVEHSSYPERILSGTCLGGRGYDVPWLSQFWLVLA